MFFLYLLIMKSIFSCSFYLSQKKPYNKYLKKKRACLTLVGFSQKNKQKSRLYRFRKKRIKSIKCLKMFLTIFKPMSEIPCQIIVGLHEWRNDCVRCCASVPCYVKNIYIVFAFRSKATYPDGIDKNPV